MDALFFIKLIVAIGFVIGLSVLAESVSPKVAGVLSGYPTGSAITLFFFGVEESAEFAAQSAVFNMIGLTAALVFVYVYYRAANFFTRHTVWWASICAITAYLATAWGLQFVEVNKYVAIFIPLSMAFFSMYLFKGVENIKIVKKAKLSFKTLVVRAFFASLIILFITTVPKFVGPTWAGLLSAFPTTLFPLMIIVHVTYSKEHVFTVLKNVPVGMFSLIIYSLTISNVYPLYGVYWGTLISYMVATAYLLVYKRVFARS